MDPFVWALILGAVGIVLFTAFNKSRESRNRFVNKKSTSERDAIAQALIEEESRRKVGLIEGCEEYSRVIQVSLTRQLIHTAVFSALPVTPNQPKKNNQKPKTELSVPSKQSDRRSQGGESAAESTVASGDEGDVEDLLLLSKFSRPAPVKPRATSANASGVAAAPKEKKPKQAAVPVAAVPIPATKAASDDQDEAMATSEDDVEEVTISEQQINVTVEEVPATEEQIAAAGDGSSVAADRASSVGSVSHDELRAATPASSAESRNKTPSPERKPVAAARAPSPARKAHSPVPAPAPAPGPTVPAAEVTALEKKLKDAEQTRNHLQLEIEQITQVHEDEVRKLKDDLAKKLEDQARPLRQELQVLRESNMALTGALAAKVSESKEAQEVMNALRRQMDEARNLLPQLDSRRLDAEARASEYESKLQDLEAELSVSRQAVQQLPVLQNQLQHVTNHLSQTAAKASALEVEVQSIKDERDGLISHALKIETEKAELDKKIGELTDANHELKARAKEAEEERTSFSKELDDIRRIASDNDELKAKFDQLSKELESTKSELAKATELGASAEKDKSLVAELEKKLKEVEAKSKEDVEKLESKVAEAENRAKEAVAAAEAKAKSETAKIQEELSKVAAAEKTASEELAKIKTVLKEAEDAKNEAEEKLRTSDLGAKSAEVEVLKMQLEVDKKGLENQIKELQEAAKKASDERDSFQQQLSEATTNYEAEKELWQAEVERVKAELDARKITDSISFDSRGSSMPQTPNRYAKILTEGSDEAIRSIKEALGGVAGSETRLNQIFALLNETETLAPEDSETLLKDALKVVASKRSDATIVDTGANGRDERSEAETVIRVKHDAKGGKLFIRGTGGDLSWDKGAKMMEEGNNKWVYIDHSGSPLEFKFLVNDSEWLPKEDGNWKAEGGQTVEI